MGFLEMILPVLLVFLSISKLYRLLIHLIWRPYAITKSFKEQGVSGPSYNFFSGSINEMKSIKLASEDHVLDIHCHDITATVFPEYCRWRSEYGKFASLWLELNDAGCKLSCLICGTGETFLHWFGPEPMLCISNPEQIKQVMANKFGFYVKPEPKASLFSLFGRGLVFTEGSDWARHRRILNLCQKYFQKHSKKGRKSTSNVLPEAMSSNCVFGDGQCFSEEDHFCNKNQLMQLLYRYQIGRHASWPKHELLSLSRTISDPTN